MKVRKSIFKSFKTEEYAIEAYNFYIKQKKSGSSYLVGDLYQIIFLQHLLQKIERKTVNMIKQI